VRFKRLSSFLDRVETLEKRRKKAAERGKQLAAEGGGRAAAAAEQEVRREQRLVKNHTTATAKNKKGSILTAARSVTNILLYCRQRILHFTKYTAPHGLLLACSFVQGEQAAEGAKHDPVLPQSATGMLNLVRYDKKVDFGAPNTREHLRLELDVRGISYKTVQKLSSENYGKLAAAETANIMLNKLLVHHKQPNLATCKNEKQVEPALPPAYLYLCLSPLALSIAQPQSITCMSRRREAVLVPKMADLNFTAGLKYRSSSLVPTAASASEEVVAADPESAVPAAAVRRSSRHVLRCARFFLYTNEAHRTLFKHPYIIHSVQACSKKHGELGCRRGGDLFANGCGRKRASKVEEALRQWRPRAWTCACYAELNEAAAATWAALLIRTIRPPPLLRVQLPSPFGLLVNVNKKHKSEVRALSLPTEVS